MNASPPPPPQLTEAQARSRRARNIALGLAIAGLVVLFYAVTVVKFGPASSSGRCDAMTAPALSDPTRIRNRKVASIVVGVAASMVGLAYAAVPLYQLFCRATGYGGTTQVSREAPALRGARSTVVSFDSNVAPGLPWTFSAEVSKVTLRNGETATVFYKVRNNSDREIAATAAYNVSPDQAGLWFNKISCFCFEEQRLGPGETAEWPVVFYLDPALEKDRTMDAVEQVTLSYTFFASKTQPSVSTAARKGEGRDRTGL